MAGLLNLDDPQTVAMLQFGLGLLNAGGYHDRRIGIGQGIGMAGQGAIGGYQDARKLQMLAEQQRANNELRRAQAERFRHLAEKGINPDDPSDIRTWREFEKMTPEQKANFILSKRSDFSLKDIEGVLNRVSLSGLGKTTPLETLQGKGEAESYLEAMKAYGTESQKAAFNLFEGYDPVTRRLTTVPRSSQVSPPVPVPPGVSAGPRLPSATGPGFPRVSPQQQAGMDSDRVRVLRDELAKTTDPVQRAALEREISLTSNGTAYGTPRAAAPAQQVAEASPRLEPPEQAKRDDERRTDRIKTESVLSYLNTAEKLLPIATNSIIGSGVDYGLSAIGVSTTSAEAADELETIAGWLTSNVPRMEGPQGVLDVQLYKQMAADVGNRQKPYPRRLASLNTLRELMRKQAEIKESMSGGVQPSGGNAPQVGARAKTKDGRNVEWDGKGWKVVP